MTKYTATFANETLTRKSDREYSHAWLITEDGRIYAKGFSGTKTLADKAPAGELSRLGMSAKDRRTPFYYKGMAKQAGVSTVVAWMDSVDDKAAQRIAAMTIEVVAVERS